MDFKTRTQVFDDVDLSYAYDSLSGLLTRNFFDLYINRLISQGKPFCLFFCDIDYFKNINDTKGHLIGDKVLTDLANAIIEATEKYNGIIGRFGGDEYVIAVEGIEKYDEAWHCANDICLKVRDLDLEYFDEGDPLKHVTITMGSVRYPINGTTYNSLLEAVDKALYRGKIKGRNCFIIYQEDLHSSILVNKQNDNNSIISQINYIIKEMSQDKSLEDNLRTVLNFFAKRYNLIFTGINLNNCIIPYYQNNDYKHLSIPVAYYDEFKGKEDLIYILSTRRYINDTNHEYYALLKEQGIRSYLACKCECNGRYYGILRFDDKRERVWNEEEKTVILTIAKIYSAFKFHNEN